MKSKDKLSNERVHYLMDKARIGWWEADFSIQSYICSEFLINLLGLGEEGVISFVDFRKLIREDYRLRIVNEFSLGKTQNVYDQVYPIETTQGVIWIRVKLCSKEMDEQGNLHTYGFMECLDSVENTDTEEMAIRQVNSMFTLLNSISCSLLSLLRSGDLSMVVNRILGEIVQYYPGGRAYIVEYDWETNTQTCSYEAGSLKYSCKKSYMKDLPMDSIPWWKKQLAEDAAPIILANVRELPLEANFEKERLVEQGVKSTMIVPMVSKERVWGYAGIDLLDDFHVWKEEEFQWFASLVNIVSICMEFRKSEKKAQSEKQFLADLYKHMPVGYVRVKMIRDEQNQIVDYTFADSNDMARILYGAEDISWVGKRASEVDVYMPERLSELKIVLSEHLPREVNYVVPKTGAYYHMIMYSPREDEVVLLFSDMTDTFSAHEALDRSERILRNIYKNLPVGIELYDKDGYLLDVNDKELEMFGVGSKEEVLGINMFDNPNFTDDMKERIRKKENTNVSLIYDFSKLDGCWKSNKQGQMNLLMKITTLYDTQGDLMNYLIINVDRTEATVAYNQIQEFKDFFTLVGDYAKVGYAHFDALSRDGYALDSWYINMGEVLGTPLPQIIGVHSHLHPEDRAVMLNFLEEVVQGKQSSLRCDVRVLRQDGQYAWTRMNVLVRDYRPGEGVIEMLCINYDITELKNTEEKLIQAKEKAEESDRLKSAFLANMSHEIRTPLNAIVGFSNLLAYAREEEEKQQYIAIVEENNELLLQLISDILDLSKIEAGTFEMVPGTFDVKQLCEDLVTSLQMKVPKGVVLRLDSDLLECQLFSDKNRIYQIISNFVNNAFKFTTSGFVTVGYLVRESEIEFYVVDTGIGIDVEKQSQIFDRFVKLNSFAHGTGLGLSICKSIIQQLGGHIGVKSEIGKGSRFWFTHPLK